MLKKEFKIPTSKEIEALQAAVDKLQKDYDNCKENKVVTTDLWGNESSESYKTETARGIMTELKKAKAALSAATDPKKQSAAFCNFSFDGCASYSIRTQSNYSL